VRLFPRLALGFGLLAALSTVGFGLSVRQRDTVSETVRFQREVEGVCVRAVSELRRQADIDRALVAATCEDGELADSLGIALDGAELDARGVGLAQRVPRHQQAFGLDELVLAADRGEYLAAAPTSLLEMSTREVDRLLAGQTKAMELRLGAKTTASMLSRCTKRSMRGRLVGVVGARHLAPLLERLGRTLDVEVVPTWSAAAPASKPAPSPSARAFPQVLWSDPSATRALADGHVRTTCRFDDGQGHALAFDIVKSTRELEEKLRDVDRAIALSAAIGLAFAFLLATLLARSLSKPLAILATEAGKVAGGEARPLGVKKGSREVLELAGAFDRMIDDLAVTRRRLAAASRVAAWREVARRVAHEVKNPLAPIRAAVETLRRLRAREDPRFDEYFDEATRTVLDEVHRIANIVTEFTRFARLPQPKPQDFDPEELARHVVQVHRAAADRTPLTHVALRRASALRADRDQVIQVLTNLVQNALDAVRETPGGSVTLTTDSDGAYVSFVVTDDGPGIAPEIAARLFEPYATTKTSGTGLGLAIAPRIAIEHDGDLSYVGPSTSGKGAAFRLLLPIEGPPPMSDVPPPSSGV
jgi:signal transduction histidine kinase